MVYNFTDVEAKLVNLNQQLDAELNKILSAAKADIDNSTTGTKDYIASVTNAIKYISGEIVGTAGYEEVLKGNDSEARKKLMQLAEDTKKEIMDKLEKVVSEINAMKGVAPSDATKDAWVKAIKDMKKDDVSKIALIKEAKNFEDLRKAMARTKLDPASFSKIDENLKARCEKAEKELQAGEDFEKRVVAAGKDVKDIPDIDKGISDSLQLVKSTKRKLGQIDSIKVEKLDELIDKIDGAKDEKEIEKKGAKKEWDSLKAAFELMDNHGILSSELSANVYDLMEKDPENAIKNLKDYLDKGAIDEAKIQEDLEKAKNKDKASVISGFLVNIEKQKDNIKVVDSSNEISDLLEEVQNCQDLEEYQNISKVLEDTTNKLLVAKSLTESMKKFDKKAVQAKINDIKALQFDRMTATPQQSTLQAPDKDKILQDVLKNKGIAGKPTEPSSAIELKDDLKTTNPFSVQLKVKDASGNIQDFTFKELPTSDMEFEVKPGVFEKVEFSKCADDNEKIKLITDIASKVSLNAIEALPQAEKEAVKKELEAKSATPPARTTSRFGKFIANLPVVKQIGKMIENKKFQKNGGEPALLKSQLDKIMALKVKLALDEGKKYNGELTQYETAEKEAENQYNVELAKYQAQSVMGSEEGKYYEYAIDRMRKGDKAVKVAKDAKKDVLYEDDGR